MSWTLSKTLSLPFIEENLLLKNRIVMAPMTRCQTPQHAPTNHCVEYYRNRAIGGVGLIITEGIAISHEGSQGYPNVPYLTTPNAKLGWRMVVDAVKKEGAKIIPQLWHVGSIRQPHQKNIPGGKSFAPSSLIHPKIKETNPLAIPPVAMNENNIADVIQSYADAAEQAFILGFDGIELHGAHGYLLDQFFWSVTNQRKDNYGGITPGERTRFATEVIQAIRLRVGKRFPVILRISQWKLGNSLKPDISSPLDLEHFLTPLLLAGVDIFHCSMHKYFEPEFKDSPLSYAGWVKKLSGKPVIAAGSIGLPYSLFETEKELKKTNFCFLEEKLLKNEFDLIALGRPLLSDPNWAIKILQNRFEDIIPFSQKDIPSS